MSLTQFTLLAEERRLTNAEGSVTQSLVQAAFNGAVDCGKTSNACKNTTAKYECQLNYFNSHDRVESGSSWWQNVPVKPVLSQTQTPGCTHTPRLKQGLAKQFTAATEYTVDFMFDNFTTFLTAFRYRVS